MLHQIEGKWESILTLPIAHKLSIKFQSLKLKNLGKPIMGSAFLCMHNLMIFPLPLTDKSFIIPQSLFLLFRGRSMKNVLHKVPNLNYLKWQKLKNMNEAVVWRKIEMTWMLFVAVVYWSCILEHGILSQGLPQAVCLKPDLGLTSNFFHEKLLILGSLFSGCPIWNNGDIRCRSAEYRNCAQYV